EGRGREPRDPGRGEAPREEPRRSDPASPRRGLHRRPRAAGLRPRTALLDAFTVRGRADASWSTRVVVGTRLGARLAREVASQGRGGRVVVVSDARVARLQ